jgi:phosphoglycerate kinase
MPVRGLADLPIGPGTRALVRVDFNVPLDAGEVADDTRIRESLPTLEWLASRGARVIVMSHLGRPQGRPDPRLSLEPVARRLGELWSRSVTFVGDTVGDAAQRAVAACPAGAAVVLENLRFSPGEEANDDTFAGALAALGDVYVDDAFGTAHRAHASTVGVARRLPAAAGWLMARELEALGRLRQNPERPYWVIVGGAKVSDKLALLDRLVATADGVAVGGGMANTFLAAAGRPVGQSRIEPDAVEAARRLLAAAEAAGRPFLLPVDVVAATAFQADAPARTVEVQGLLPNEMALDVGPATVARLEAALATARTVFWNGPMGVFEWDRFSQGTMAVAHLLARLQATVVVGGGDSVAAVNRAGVAAQLTHVSTGGGAALELLEGRTLPGVAVLEVSDG